MTVPTQETGNFCGKCGTNLNETVTQPQTSAPVKEDNQPKHEQQTEMVSSINSNEKLEKLKNESSQYMSYFMDQMKQPSKNFFDTVAHFKQNIISIAVYLVLCSAVIYAFLSNMGYEGDLGIVELPSKTSIIFKLDLLVLLMIGFGMLSAFITTNLFGPEASIKTIVSQCASYFAVPIITLIITILAILIDSVYIGLIFLAISLLLVMLVIPMFVVVMSLQKQSKKIERFYAYLISLAIIVILNFIFYIVLMQSVISNMFE
ncbi:hypothetical protein [Lysinibacillus sp. NPDC056185]|uniref:hypothetical protein n=1 Tax=Lysinibacillus sp. NPDC056185 TaxID=3345739 RepID=UPI0039F105B7